MKKLGSVVAVTKDGYVVVRPSIAVDQNIIGSFVFDSNMRRLGKIVDLIGRVADPRVVVKLESRDLAASIKEPMLYFVAPTKPARRRRAGR